MTDQADRDNTGKVKYSLIDMNCLIPCANMLEYGANKYSRDNWKKGMPVTQILDSLLRHIAALQKGEFIDPESGLPHIGAIQCNALFLGNSNNTVDIIESNFSITPIIVTSSIVVPDGTIVPANDV